MSNTVVDMAEHFDPNDTLDDLRNNRFAMPPVVIAAFRQAGQQATLKLLHMLNDEKFDKLPIKDQLEVIKYVHDRAYGRSESASASLIAMHKTGQLDAQTGHSERLDAITQRMVKNGEKHPEMAKSERATRRVGSKEPSAKSPGDRFREFKERTQKDTVEDDEDREVVQLRRRRGA